MENIFVMNENCFTTKKKRITVYTLQLAIQNQMIMVVMEYQFEPRSKNTSPVDSDSEPDDDHDRLTDSSW